MKHTTLAQTVGATLMICGIALTHPFSTTAQETTPVQPEKPAGNMGMHRMMGKEPMPGMMAEMQQQHEQMEKMHQEMTQELQKQMTALREHPKAMEGISDEKQLLAEMKKHQQMMDAFLGTMLEQREKMHAQMEERHQQMQKRMRKGQPAEGSGVEQPAEHEAHHGQ